MSSYPNFGDLNLSRAFSLKQSEQTVDPTLRDSMENGMETTRARFTRVRRTFSMALDHLTADDKAALDLFTQSTVQFGALPFLITDPRNLESPQTYLVRFASLPKYVDDGWINADTSGNAAQFRYNCTFQVREM